MSATSAHHRVGDLVLEYRSQLRTGSNVEGSSKALKGKPLHRPHKGVLRAIFDFIVCRVS